jgi:predicted phage terminase large subunit-like protein
MPPGYGKTEMVVNFVAWCIAKNPDSKFLYLSFSRELAGEQTAKIKDIVSHPHFQRLFGVSIRHDSDSKLKFKTTHGGEVYAAGVQGTITGFDAGKHGADRQSGGIIIDDSIKPAEALSDIVRKSTNDWFKNTVLSRLRGNSAWIIFIGQRLHEDDLAGNLIGGMDVKKWDKLVFPALDENDNALYEEHQSAEMLKKMRELSPYDFASQYQQEPQAPGGSLFIKEYFPLVDEIPDIKNVFITVDTAETSKQINDATVFSFWGEYKLADINMICWLDCIEIRVEPKDLMNEFMQFYNRCKQFWGKPFIAHIETKSTGTTLYSIMSQQSGLIVKPIKRGVVSKITRICNAQPFSAAKQITFIRGAKHYKMCVDHLLKITRNESHRHDDIADTLADAVELALLRKPKMPTIRFV